MHWNSDELAAVESGQTQWGLFMSLQIPNDPLNLWFGFGDIIAGYWYPALGTAIPTLFRGAGQITSVPEIEHFLNGTAGRWQFSLSGVSDEGIRIVGQHRHLVRHAPFHVGLALFDLEWQLLGSIKWIQYAIASYATQQIRSEDDGTITNTISISVGTRFTGRENAQNSYYTDPDQQRRFPGDKGCERTILYTHETTKTFPRFQG